MASSPLRRPREVAPSRPSLDPRASPGATTAWSWAADPQRAIAASGHRAIGIQLLRDVGRTAGNRAVEALLHRSGHRPPPTLQRQPPEGDAPAIEADAGEAEAATTFVLTNARFTPHDRLQEIASGGAPLSKKDKAPVVKATQTALLDIGYSLLRFHDDGSYGDETAEAISQFRVDKGVGSGNELDAKAMQALDKAATPPGKVQQHYLDYSRLFADDRLDVTLAIGYDEGQTHFDDVAAARDWLTTHAMTAESKAAPALPAVDAGPDAAKELEEAMKKGISTPEKWTGTKSVTYPDKDGTSVTKDITVSITLVPPGTGAKAAFAKGLNESELMLYSGHARMGIGPDFDKDKSPYENFVIGVNSALHKAKRSRLIGPKAEALQHYEIDKHKNDLEAMKDPNVWDAEKYRVWFFAACTSLAYFDELRGGLLPEKMDRHNLDLFGTTQSLPIAAGLAPVWAQLEGILAAETMEQIVERMQTSSFEAFRKKVEESKKLSAAQKKAEIKSFGSNMFLREGAGDNPVAP